MIALSTLLASGNLKAEEMHPSHTNSLIRESSPYLLQHAHNPVDWYAWGPEAFEKARLEDKPVFLSIGYSTCHWCHVMERESFENEDTAKLLNERFVSIKVDREERPDVDGIYMQFVMAATGSGGWPMSVFLTADKKPFFGGTYFPPEDRHGLPGFPTLLRSIVDAWKNRRDEITRSADSSAVFLAGGRMPEPASALTERTLERAVETFSVSFDEARGGFGHAPKFPRSHALSFLLGEAHYAKTTRALQIAEKTLVEIARGGIFDQLGGGFHRYSTDALWRVPHFEKMLYDQALLVRTYVDAYRLTQNPEYARVARETLDFVLHELTDPQGGFYSAIDADSAPAVLSDAKASADGPALHREGAYYVWTRGELDAALGAERAAPFAFHYGVEEKGNAISDPHGELTHQNVLYLAHPTAETAARFGRSESEMSALLAGSRAALLRIRDGRPRPPLDDKVLADWNGLMIGAFAEAARALDEPRYLEAAHRAAGFIETHLVEGGRLHHRWRAGKSAIPAFSSDEVFLASGYLSLYEAGLGEKWLARARELADDLIERFRDHEHGGFFVSAVDAEPLVGQPKEIVDGAVPSGNSAAAHLFHRLANSTDRELYRQTADRVLEVFSGTIAADPANYTQALLALRLAIGPSREVTLTGRPGDPALAALARETGFSFSPNQVTLFKPADTAAAATVCVKRACGLPLTDAARLREALKRDTPNA